MKKQFSLKGVISGLWICWGLSLFFQNCSPTRFSNTASSEMPVAIAEVKAVTCIYEGVTYPEGKEIKTFRSSSIGPTQQCESEARKCTQSGFTGSFQFPKCTNQPFSDCPVFDGKVVKHGETVNAYSNSAPAFGADCNALATRRYCYNGVLDGDQSFRFRNCIPGAAKNCSVGLVNVFHNSSVTFWNKEKVLFGEAVGCLSQSRKCTDGKLDGDVSYIYEKCDPQQVNSKEIPVTSTISNEMFNIILIIDDSKTMTLNQKKVSDNIDSLLKPLEGLNVALKVMTTSDFVMSDTTFKFYKADGSFTTNTNTYYQGPEGLPEYLDSSIVKIERRHKNLEYINNYGHNNFLLKSTDSSIEIAATISGIKKLITDIGKQVGASDEKVLCPLLRHFDNYKFDSYYRDSKKTAVVVITDEDDSSASSNCVKEVGFDVGPLVESLPQQREDYYTVRVKGVRVYFDYKSVVPEHKVDGITIPQSVQVLGDGYTYFDLQTIPAADASCKTIAQNFIRQQPPLLAFSQLSNNPMPNVYFENSIVYNCEVVTLENNQIIRNGDNVFGKNYCDLSLKNDSGLTMQQNPNFVQLYGSGGGYPFRFDRAVLGEIVSCSRNVVTPPAIKSRLQVGIPDASYGSLKKESSINEFDSLVFDGFKTKFGTDFLINFIINPSDGVCGMTFEGDQTFGKRYEDFAKKDPSRIRIYPICANTYEKVLSDTSQFITEIIATKFDLNLPISARVVEVYLDSTKIDASKYVISGNTIELRTDLRAGQKLIVKYVQM